MLFIIKMFCKRSSLYNLDPASRFPSKIAATDCRCKAVTVKL
uniref:Uncharacterized protein n=1 Tax=Arundo donax TaxID=35708 RepID=A0A0A9DVS0_ARUDO